MVTSPNSRLALPAAALVLLGLSLMPPSVSAQGPPPEPDCQNYGNIVNVGSSYDCLSSNDCTNYGIVVNVGSSFDCAKECENLGVTVNVGSSYCGDERLRACAEDMCFPASCSDYYCTSRSSGPDAASVPDFWVGSCHLSWRIIDNFRLECGHTEEGCGVGLDPLCWTVRSVCQGAPVNQDGIMYCPGQPDAGGEPGEWA